MVKYDLTASQLEYFKMAYYTTPNTVLQRELCSLETTSRGVVTQKCIHANARRFNLKKDKFRQRQYQIDLKIKQIKESIHWYCGKPMNELLRITPSESTVIRLYSTKDINSLKTACWRFNHGKGALLGTIISAKYDKERLLAILSARTISQASPCRALSFQGEVLYVPP